MGRSWQLAYAVRNRSRIAFYEELAGYGDKVRFHCDDEYGGPLPVAQCMTLSPGDLILTGTPDGVVDCKPGDVVVTEIERIGTLVNTIQGKA